jgi:pimeloyl-ACP methyl ester carboxylesterase
MARHSDITGHYSYITIDDVEYRIYWEEAGEGIPLVCQHTAGADGRQYRHLLEDRDITSRFRVIVHDLPYHGKSLPPESEEWWTERYGLTMDFFMKCVVSMRRELELEDAVYMGCSMGGHLAPDLALHYPGEFRAVIGVQAAIHSHGIDTLMKWYNHPNISNAFKAAQMYTVCSPLSPEPSRRETVWVYSQGAPVVFKGDLDYYLVEHDLTETARQIDTSKTEVHIMNGEYDYSAAPADGRALADMIEGSTFTEMKGLGHFGMSEDYQTFKRHVMPILRGIAERATTAQTV